VVRKADAAALLPADEHVALHHLLVDPLEADGRRGDLEAKVARVAVDEYRGRERLDDATGLALVLDEVAGHQADDAVRADELAISVHGTDAVSITVGHERSVVAARADQVTRGIDPGDDWLGVQSTEAGIALVVDLGDIHAKAAQGLGEVGLAGAVQRVDDDPEPGRSDRVGIDKATEVGEIRADKVSDLELAASGRNRVREGGLDTLGECDRRRSAIGHAELEAEVLGGVVARGEHDAAHGGLITRDRPTERRRRQIGIRNDHTHTVRRDDFGGGASERLGLEACVIADDDGAAGVLGGKDATGSICDSPQAVVGEVGADHGAPPVGAKADVCGHEESFVSDRP